MVPLSVIPLGDVKKSFPAFTGSQKVRLAVLIKVRAYNILKEVHHAFTFT
jgi:hypothetical protein